MAWLAGWSKREAITVDDGTGDLTDYTKLVILTADADRADALVTGHDIRFTQADGTTLLFYKREAWAGGGGGNVTAIFKVKIPSIDGVTGAVIYIYWGNAAAADVSDTVNCWKAALAEAYDMEDTTTGTISGDKGINGVKSSANNPAVAAGKIGNAQDFSGDVVDLAGLTAYANTSAHSYCAWVFADNVSGFRWIINNGSLTEGTSLCLSGGKVAIFYTGGGNLKVGATAITTGSWFHVAVTRAANHACVFYRNGVPDGTANTDSSWTAENLNPRLGAWYSGAYLFDGKMDDIRIYSAVLTAAEVEYMFGEVNEAGNRLTWGGVETAAAAAAIGGPMDFSGEGVNRTLDHSGIGGLGSQTF